QHVPDRLGGAGGSREVGSEQLLVSTHDPQLVDGRLAIDALEARDHSSGLEAVGQAVGGLVASGDDPQPA
ncbi:hypothetical protein ACLBSJ_34145, partial [Klebsiella pneumoniae]|uniref:hypothetical protein n=1 Tax=Klebsiella pneumoniae TaxID=573 RepID=UPI003969546C